MELNNPNPVVPFVVHTSEHSHRWKFALAYAYICILVVRLSLSTPITFDESFNWNYYSNFSFFGIISDYSVSWNNQVPFTLLQQIIPLDLLSASPWNIRIFSTLIGLLLPLIVLRQSWFRNADVRFPILLITGSPLIISYLFIARSYSFTALLLVSAFVLSSGKEEGVANFRSFAASVLFAVAAWALPTNLFLAPGWFFYQFLRRRFSHFLLQIVTFCILITAFFLPSFTKMIKLARNNSWSGSPSFFGYVNEFSFVWQASFFALLFMLIRNKASVFEFVFRSTSKFKIGALNRFDFMAVSAIISSLSYFVFILLAYLAGMGWPFARNATAPLWIFILGMSVLPISFSLKSKLVMSMLCSASLIGLFSLGNLNSGDNLRRLNPVLYETVPVGIRDLERHGVTKIFCSSFDAPVCILSIGLLQKQNIAMQFSDGLVSNLPCVLGNTKPPKQWQVRLFKGDSLWGQLCH